MAKATGVRMMVTAPIVVVDGFAGDVVPTTVTRRPAAASARASFLTRVSVATSLATSMTTCTGLGRPVTCPSAPGESRLTEKRGDGWRRNSFTASLWIVSKVAPSYGSVS